MIKPYPYPAWTIDHARRLLAADAVPVSQQLVDKPRRHYAVKFSDGTTLAFEDSPSKVVGATEDKGGAMAYYGASHAADYLLDNISDVHDELMCIPNDGRDYMAEWEATRLKWWTEARKQHTKHRDTAADTGNAVHYYIEDMLKAVAAGHRPIAVPDGISDPVARGIDAFRAWWSVNQIEVTHSEVPVCHPMLGYAGTIDVVGEDTNGQGVIIDWKTSKSIYPSHIRQVAAYALAWGAMDRNPILSAYIVHLVKEGPDAGQFKVHEITPNDLNEAEDAWIDSLNLYRFTKSVEQRLKGKTT